MTDQELQAQLQRICAGRTVSRRGFLAGSRSPAMSAFLAACTGSSSGGTTSAATPTAPRRGDARSPSFAGRRAAQSTEGSSTCTTGPTTSTRATSRSFKKRLRRRRSSRTTCSRRTRRCSTKLQARRHAASTTSARRRPSSRPTCSTRAASSPKHRLVEDPEREVHRQAVQGPLVGPERTSTSCPRTGARPASPSGRSSSRRTSGPGRTSSTSRRSTRARSSSSTRRATSSSAPLKALGYSPQLGRSRASSSKARDLLMGLAPHVLALDSDTYEEADPDRGGRPRPDLDRRRRRARATKPKTADTKYIIPEDGTLYWMDTWVIFKDAAAPERGPRLPELHPGPGRSRPRRRSRTATPRRTTRRRSSCPRRSSTTRRSSCRRTIFDSGLLEGAKDVSTDPHRVEIWEEFKSKIGKKWRPVGPRPHRGRSMTAPCAGRRRASARWTRPVGGAVALARRACSPALLWYLLLLVAADRRSSSSSASGTRSKIGGYAGGFTFDNYATALDELDPFMTSLQLSIVGTILCLLVGLPLAYFIATRAGKRKSLLIVLLVIPFWTSFLIRTYAWLMILGPDGLAGFIGDVDRRPDASGSSARRRRVLLGPRLRLPAADGLPALRDARADGPDARRGVQGPRRRPLGDVPPDHAADHPARPHHRQHPRLHPDDGRVRHPPDPRLRAGRTRSATRSSCAFLEARNWPAGSAKAVVADRRSCWSRHVLRLVHQPRPARSAT